jgi:hypothetical protein
MSAKINIRLDGALYHAYYTARPGFVESVYCPPPVNDRRKNIADATFLRFLLAAGDHRFSTEGLLALMGRLPNLPDGDPDAMTTFTIGLPPWASTAIRTLKERLIRSHIGAYIAPSTLSVARTLVSTGLGQVLVQDLDDVARPLLLAGRTLKYAVAA